VGIVVGEVKCLQEREQKPGGCRRREALFSALSIPGIVAVMPRVLHIPLAMGASGMARQQCDAQPRKSSWRAIPTKCMRSLDVELLGH
jgi:hypothetical protein